MGTTRTMENANFALHGVLSVRVHPSVINAIHLPFSMEASASVLVLPKPITR